MKRYKYKFKKVQFGYQKTDFFKDIFKVDNGKWLFCLYPCESVKRRRTVYTGYTIRIYHIIYHDWINYYYYHSSHFPRLCFSVKRIKTNYTFCPEDLSSETIIGPWGRGDTLSLQYCETDEPVPPHTPHTPHPHPWFVLFTLQEDSHRFIFQLRPAKVT